MIEKTILSVLGSDAFPHSWDDCASGLSALLWVMAHRFLPIMTGHSQPRPSRLEEARRLIEAYADDLREIIKKLRRHLN